VRLTEAGLKLVDAVLPDHVATENRLLEAVSETEREAVADTLRTPLESLGDKAA
jgi:DNA-binding MarR family transcriptional regulator